MIIATLDACVLYKGLLTNLLLWIAAQGAFDPAWSAEIHDEWSRNLADHLPPDKPERPQSDGVFRHGGFSAPDVIACQVHVLPAEG